MTYQVLIMPEADSDLEKIAAYIALDNPPKAYEFIDSLVESFTTTLSTFPKSGVVYKGEIRKISFRKRTAFYLIDEAKKQVNILHVIDQTKPLYIRNIEF